MDDLSKEMTRLLTKHLAAAEALPTRTFVGMNRIADGVREYAENDPVEINRREQNGGRLTVDATNEGGYNGTSIDLEDLLAWVSREMPELYLRFMPRA